MKVRLQQKDSGLTKEVKIGFSWTMLFFGLFVPLIRGDLKWTLLSLIISIVTAGIGWLVLPFVYNKLYIKGLLESGYAAADESSKTLMQSKGIVLG